MDFRPPDVSPRWPHLRRLRDCRQTGPKAAPTGRWTIPAPTATCPRPCAASAASTRAAWRNVINLDDGDQYDWPFLYGVEVGHWNLTDAQAKALREFVLRGGFFMCDDFHGQIEWDVFVESMHRVFPDRPIVDIPNGDPIFHTIYDLDERFQVPGALLLETHLTYEKGETGKVPHWRGIYDDRGRVMVAMCHNMDLGDSWEHADNPLYPEKYSSLGIRIALNYITYSMTH